MLEMLFIMMATSNVCNYSSSREFLPDVVSTVDAHEGVDWVSIDGTSVLFTRALPDFSASTLMQATNVDGSWTVKQISISGDGFDAGLSISRSGDHALFTSTRGVDGGTIGNWDIWRANTAFHQERWRFGDPELMPAPVNTAHSECCVVHGEDDDFYFSSDRRGSWDIYHAKPDHDGYHVSFLTGGVNTNDGAWPSAVMSNPNRLLFSSIRESGAGGDDIYVSAMVAGEWTPGKLLGTGINRPGYEDRARVFGTAFYWSSRPKNGENTEDLKVSNIYTMPSTCIDELG